MAKSKTILPLDPNNPGLSPAPIFTEVDPIRSVNSNLGEVLKELEERMPRGHQYQDSDRITWAHETTHGLNSRIRNLHHKPGMPNNAFYVLHGLAIIAEEPPKTLRDVANAIPRELQGGIYRLYLVNQQRWWNDRPLYVWDEWSAYQNGSLCRMELEITDRAETITYMLEMLVYGTYAILDTDFEGVEGSQRLSACGWLARRTMRIYHASNGRSAADQYISAIRQYGSELIDFWSNLDVDTSIFQ